MNQSTGGAMDTTWLGTNNPYESCWLEAFPNIIEELNRLQICAGQKNLEFNVVSSECAWLYSWFTVAEACAVETSRFFLKKRKNQDWSFKTSIDLFIILAFKVVL